MEIRLPRRRAAQGRRKGRAGAARVRHVSFGPVTDPTPVRRPSTGPVQYKGENLDSERGPGLGCFRFQLIVLAILIVLTPVSVALAWPYEVSAALLLVTIVLLLLAGQTIIFLLRLVAAERRGRRRPLAARTPTVGELEDAGRRHEAGTLEAADSGAVDAGKGKAAIPGEGSQEERPGPRAPESAEDRGA
jgi:hypothetical protein